MAARLVVLGLLVAGCQCWETPAVNQGRRAQYYVQQNDGSYHYGFDTAEGLYQSQQGDQANEVSGQFGADGGKVEYTAGVDGFVVTSLKKADATATKAYVHRAPVRYATLEELATHPEQVDDTPEVKAAKASFRAAYNAAAAAAEAAPDVNIITGAAPAVAVHTATYSAPAPQTFYLAPTQQEIKYSGPAAQVDASGHVVDTAEVKAAKATFQAAYDAAAAAAEAAPDVNIITGAAPAVAVHTATYSAPAPQAFYLAPTQQEIKYSGPAAQVDASGNVVDTAEVKAAKATFQAAYDAAAAAAEAAPDVNIITGTVQAPAAVPVIHTYGHGAASKPSEIVDFRSTSNDDSSYEFSYTTSDSSRYESADAANNVQGNFEFVADDAQRRRVDYRAGAETGFVASGAHLPVSVQDTAAVASAKALFKSAFESAAAAAEAAPADEINTGYAPVVAVNTATYSAPAPQTYYLAPTPIEIKYYDPAAPVDASGNVVDTAEVRAAKATFRAAYNAAAAAAEAAPDVNIITGPIPALAVNTATYSAPAPQDYYLAPTQQEIKYSGPAAPVDASGNVVDTAAVKAAKATFQAAYDAAAAAAEAAPDNDIITASVQSPAAIYSAATVPVSQTTYSASHGNMRTVSFDGITLMQADGPYKFGYSYE